MTISENNLQATNLKQISRRDIQAHKLHRHMQNTVYVLTDAGRPNLAAPSVSKII